ncbi:MAG: hypothetical protein ACRBCI_01975 [Cellvibrionaceae bacterium]
MATSKGKTEGGSGGKRGHSNMEHWEFTEEIKRSTKVIRRENKKKEIRKEVNNINNESIVD